MEEYTIETAAEYYKYTEEQVSVGRMVPGREIKNVAQADPWMDQKQSLVLSPTGADNTMRNTASV